MDINVKRALKRLRKEKAEFIKQVSNSAAPSREQIILQNYETLLINSAEWRTKKFDRDQGDSRPENTKVVSRQKLAVGEILNAIKEDPNQKVFLLNKFLRRFAAISDKDRGVILESFKALPPDKLRGEMENLEHLFT